MNGTTQYGDRSAADLCDDCGSRIKPGNTLCGRCAQIRRHEQDDATASSQRLANHHHAEMRALISAWCAAVGLPERRAL